MTPEQRQLRLVELLPYKDELMKVHDRAVNHRAPLLVRLQGWYAVSNALRDTFKQITFSDPDLSRIHSDLLKQCESATNACNATCSSFGDDQPALDVIKNAYRKKHGRDSFSTEIDRLYGEISRRLEVILA